MFSTEVTTVVSTEVTSSNVYVYLYWNQNEPKCRFASKILQNVADCNKLNSTTILPMSLICDHLSIYDELIYDDFNIIIYDNIMMIAYINAKLNF